jgi:hypothetical protein
LLFLQEISSKRALEPLAPRRFRGAGGWIGSKRTATPARLRSDRTAPAIWYSRNVANFASSSEIAMAPQGLRSRGTKYTATVRRPRIARLYRPRCRDTRQACASGNPLD